MKTLYLDCSMGAAGDMLMAALYELSQNGSHVLSQLNNADIPGVTVRPVPAVKQGISGTRMDVRIHGEAEHEHHHEHVHDHNNLHHIKHIIQNLAVSSWVKDNALTVYQAIAEAESRVHGEAVDMVHFHEVGAMDAVADIVGVCLFMEYLAPEQVLASPVHVGSGTVHCAHGILPVPAPATALLLQGIPVYGGDVSGELCTPTGAALLRHFVNHFGAMPEISISKIGYGMGHKNFPRINCLRGFLGETAEQSGEEYVTEFICNIDDMTPESVAFAGELLLDSGALDVYTVPLGMKKGRMGVGLHCMCQDEDKERIRQMIFAHTATLGLREYHVKRHVLDRKTTEIQTKYGVIRIKAAHGYHAGKYKAEYEDAARLALKHGLPLRIVLAETENALQQLDFKALQP